MKGQQHRPVRSNSSGRIVGQIPRLGRPSFAFMLALMASVAAVQRGDKAAAAPLFADQIAPLFKEHCYSCHSHDAAAANGGLMLDSEGGWKAGSSRGPVIVPGKPGDSRLIDVVQGRDEKHNSAVNLELTPEQINILGEWITGGASGAPAVESASPPDRIQTGSKHWSFQPVHQPEVPNAQANSSELRNEIDDFVARRLGQDASAIRPGADRRTLIRRVYFDLTGLPPLPEDVEAFTSDPDPRAYEKLVDQLLESPRYGERWGRHWLDVVGFAESSMFIGDVPRQGFWRYRDYVIRAFNEDKSFDQFVVEQLAGDELFNWRAAGDFTPEQIDLLAATGFLRCTPDATDNQAITQMDKRFIAQQAAVETSMKALMGLTVNCVRCHDHKFDPITQEEYYGLTAVFQPVYDPEQWLPGIWTAENAGPLRAIPLLPADERREVMDESRHWFDERLELGAQLKGGIEQPFRDKWLREQLDQIEDDVLRNQLVAALEKPADARSEDDENLCRDEATRLGLTEEKMKELFPECEVLKAGAMARKQEINDRNKEVFQDVIWAAFDTSTKPTPTHLLKRGNYEMPDYVVPPGVIAVLDAPERAADFERRPGEWTTGRRLALARWLTHPEHPLLARVMVNRIWQYHFGTGIVSTPDDFGARGARPVSQELLDWLAAEFVENGWSMKRMHRLILGSATYRQRSVAHYGDLFADGQLADLELPVAAFRPGPRRLEAEAIRDAMLEVSGRLDKRMFGKSVPTERRGDGSFAVKHKHPDRLRRSVYIHTRRTFVPTFLTLFDEPQMDTNWSKRSTSAIAQQALALMNAPFVVECAHVFAERVKSESYEDFESRLARSYSLAYQRQPTEDEVETIRQATEDLENPWLIICQSLLSSSEFLYVD